MRKNLYGLVGLGLAALCIVILISMTAFHSETDSTGHSVEAQATAGYTTRLYRQVPADALTGITAAEVLGYGFKFNGATWDRTRVQSKLTAVSLGAGTTETTIWDPAAGKKFRLMGFVLTASAGTLLTFKDDTGGTTIFTLTVPAGVPVVVGPDVLGNGIVSGAADRVLTVTRGTSSTLDGFLVGQEN
jgi:hypothetical protein